MTLRTTTARLLAALALLACAAPAAEAKKPKPKPSPEPSRVLVYSATQGFRHASIETAKQQFLALEQTGEFDVELTEDPSAIDAANLARFDAIAFVSATGEQPWSDRQKQDLLDWLAQGHGVLAAHASIDGNYWWSDWGDVLGGYFYQHPHTGEATNVVEDRGSPFTAHLPERFVLNEEYYRLQVDPRDNVHVLTSLDETTIPSGTGALYVDDQPTAWCQEVGGGRAWSTVWGHFDESWTNPQVWTAIVEGLRWAAGRTKADCTPAEPQPATRVQAEDADAITLAEKESSPFDGANQVVSRIRTNGFLKFEDVDLTGVESVTASVSPETAPDPQPYQLPQSVPALGGSIRVVLDALPAQAGKAGPAVSVQPGSVPSTALDGLLGGDGIEWPTVEVPVPAGTTGRHDVFLVFSHPVLGPAGTGTAIAAPEAVRRAYLMSVDWVDFGRR